MRFGRRASTPDGRRVDELSDLADQAMLRAPDTPAATAAVTAAVEAAERLVAHDSGAPQQRRLARALWRRLSTMALPADRIAAEATAIRLWGLCARLLEATAHDPAAFDAVVDDIGRWAGLLMPMLGATGRHDVAATVYERAVAAAERATGPGGRHARARLQIFALTAAADMMAAQRNTGRWDTASAQSADAAVAACREVLDVLREHLADGPFEVSEAARTMEILSRLLSVAGRLRDAAVTLDEAITLLAGVAGGKPRYEAQLGRLRDEIAALRSAAPRLTAPPPSPGGGMPPAAFARAARDAGLPPDALVGTDPGAAAAVDQAREAARDDPGRHGPGLGLLMAWRARLLTGAGDPVAGLALAEQAVRQLSAHSDQPARIQAALLAALVVVRGAATATGSTDRAAAAGQRATALHAALIARDPGYQADLAGAV